MYIRTEKDRMKKKEKETQHPQGLKRKEDVDMDIEKALRLLAEQRRIAEPEDELSQLLDETLEDDLLDEDMLFDVAAAKQDPVLPAWLVDKKDN